MKIEELLKLLQSNHSGKTWYGGNMLQLLEELKSANPNAVFRNSNSIGQILEHMAQWKIFVLEKLKGNAPYDIEMNSQTDWNKNKVYSNEEFLEVINQFINASEELIALIKVKAEEFLKEKVRGRSYSFEVLLNGILQHDIYHAGQLALLKR